MGAHSALVATYKVNTNTCDSNPRPKCTYLKYLQFTFMLRLADFEALLRQRQS